MATLVATCDESDYDAVAGTCSAVVWVPKTEFSMLPTMSAATGAAIGAALFALMGLAYLLRKARSAG